MTAISWTPTTSDADAFVALVNLQLRLEADGLYWFQFWLVQEDSDTSEEWETMFGEIRTDVSSVDSEGDVEAFLQSRHCVIEPPPAQQNSTIYVEIIDQIGARPFQISWSVILTETDATPCCEWTARSVG